MIPTHKCALNKRLDQVVDVPAAMGQRTHTPTASANEQAFLQY